jgi:autotransporter-associated beta strand protein
LTGNNTYAGGTTVLEGTLILDPSAPANSVLGTGPLTFSGGPATLQLRASSALANKPLRVNGYTGVQLSGITTVTDLASLTMSGGYLAFTGPSTLPNAPYYVSLGTGPGSTVSVQGATFSADNNGTGAGTLYLGSLVSTVGFGFFDGTVTLNAPATDFGPGTRVDIGGIGQNSAPIKATLNSNNATALGTATVVNLNHSGATFNVGVSQRISSLWNGAEPGDGGPNTSVNLNPLGTPSQLTIGDGSTDNSASTYSGSIGGAGGSIVLDKAGALTLSGVNTYTGATTVNRGTLRVYGSLATNGAKSTYISAGTDFTTASLVRLALHLGGSYSGLGATAIGNAPGLLSSAAEIRAGHEHIVVSNGVAMQWRVRNSGDAPRLVSDVLNLTGMSILGGHVQTDPFALQMTYNPTVLDGVETVLAADGLIDLAWLDTTLNQPFGLWQNATTGNFGTGLPGDAVQNYQGSWDSFAAANSVTDSNVGNFLGSYGVDVASHTVWAVVNHNSQFAVVPEPSSFFLITIGAAAGFAIRRRNQHCGRIRV